MQWGADGKLGLSSKIRCSPDLELPPGMRRVPSARANHRKLQECGASAGKHCAQAADEAARTELSPNQAEVLDDISLGDYASHSLPFPLIRDCKTKAEVLLALAQTFELRIGPAQTDAKRGGLTHRRVKIPELLA